MVDDAQRGQEGSRSFWSAGMKKKVTGYLSALMVSISAAVVIVVGQLLGDSVPPFQTNFSRFILQTIIAVFFIIVTKTNPKLPLEWRPALVMILSILFNFGAGVLFIVSAWYLPAASVQGLLESVFMTLSAIVAITRKNCTYDLPFSIVLCYVGCLLMIQPPGIFTNPLQIGNCSLQCHLNVTLLNNCSLEACHMSHGMETLYGVLSVSGVAFCLWAHAQFNVEQLNKWMSILSILFWLGIGCSLLSAPVLGILREPFVIPSGSQVGLEILFGMAFSANVFFIMYAVTILPLSHIAVILPSGLVFLYILQKTLLKGVQPGPDNWIAILGLILTLFGMFVSPTCDILRERMKSSRSDETEPDGLNDGFDETKLLINTE